MFKLIAVSSALVGLASALTVNTPAALVQCQPALLSWSDGTAPYYVAIIPGGQPSAAALENLPTQQGLTYTWTVDQAAGKSVTIKITDSTGTINYSDQVTIQAGTSTTCGSSSGSSGSSAAPAAAASIATGGSSSASRTALSTVASSSSSAAAAATSASKSATSGIAAAGAATPSSASTSSTTSHSGAATNKAAASGLLLGAMLVLALAA